MSGISGFFSAIVGVKTAGIINRRRMAILLATLVLLILACPLADFADQARLVIAGATVGFLLSCLQQVDDYPPLRLPSRLMVVLWLIIILSQPWLGADWAASAAAATLATLVLTVLWLAAGRLMRADHVDGELLCGALGAYLLLGVFWAETYQIISFVAPAAFVGPGGVAPNWSALLYFSFTTLTTTGYGDITAVNPVVRMWTVMEAIIGTMYNATVIARLVSLYGSRVSREDR